MRVEEIFTEEFDRNLYYKSFRGRLKKMYEKARDRTRAKGYPDLISEEDFFKFAENDKTYEKLHKEWEESGFDIRLTPTLDRVKVKKGYVKGNLQFLSYSENVVKGNGEYDKRPYEARRQPVTLVRGKETRTFKSMAEVAKFLSVHPSTITRKLKNSTDFDGWQLKLS